MTTFRNVIYLSGDDYTEAEEHLYPGRTENQVFHGIYMGPPDIDALFRYLMQWEMDGDGELYNSPPWGTGDNTREFNDGEYVLSWSTTYGHCALTHVTEPDDV